jgi:hypothetical protein
VGAQEAAGVAFCRNVTESGRVYIYVENPKPGSDHSSDPGWRC